MTYNMYKDVKKEGDIMNNYEKIKSLLEKNNGILYVKELEKNNIHRQYLKILEERGEVIRVIKGLYVAPDKDINEFFIMGERYKTGIFSHNTALYFYHLTDRTPMSLDMTFPSNVRVNNDFLEPHYIKSELHSLGETTLKLEDGTNIKIYDLERTICDIIRDRNKIDPQIFNTAMKEYFKSNKRNLNLSYLYIKSLPYIDDKGKEILKQIKDIDFNMIKNSRHNYKYKVKDFLSYIIYKNIQDNLVVDKENEITKELSILPDIIDDEKESLARYEENLDETKYLCYDYVNMLMFNTARKNREKIKLNIKSVNEIRNKHDNVTTYTNIDRETHLVKIKKDSVFNELRNILPSNFEWIKTRKSIRYILHLMLWSG